MNIRAIGHKPYEPKKPTLEAQIRISKMPIEKIRKFFVPTGLDRIDMKLNQHCHILWSILHWNWFCVWCGGYHFHWTLGDKCNKQRASHKSC